MTKTEVYDRYRNFPDDLKSVNQFVCWVGADKIPKNPHTGNNAQSNNQSTWGSFDQAAEACERYGFDGVGFMFAPPYFGVDLDHCVDNPDFCNEFVETLQSYAEYSKSGEGLHIICRGTLPDGARRRGPIEMYQTGRYFICTGNVYNHAYTSVNECTDRVKILHTKYMPENTPKRDFDPNPCITMEDEEVLEKARGCRNGTIFSMLYDDGDWAGLGYPSQSEADFSLCVQLAFWTGRNKEQIDRLFRDGGLMRDKWDRRQSGSTYGKDTVMKACNACENVYVPGKYGDDKDLAIAFFGDGKAGVGAPGSGNCSGGYDMNDTGNAQRFYDKFGRVVKYSYNRKKWYFWNGKRWIIDEMGTIKKMADEICQDMKQEAMGLKDKDEKSQLIKFANRTASSSSKEAMIKECQHLKDIPASPDDFDPNNDYLNCQNGVVNLRNGELTPHDEFTRDLMMTKICDTEYDTAHKPPVMWLRFLDDVTGGNKELQDYIQKCVGYSLHGSTKEQCAYFLYGLGNNGKSTFLGTISEMMGNYASHSQADTFMLKSKMGGNGASSDIARLKSTRFVTCEEPTEGMRLDEGLMKQLTGGEPMTCRFLYGDDFEYVPEFKIWMATNHKPIIRGTDHGIWRRIKLIPFDVNIPKEKVDKNLKYKLRAELPQILAWAVEGCIKWQNEGIEDPACVVESTEEYKSEMDLVAGFVDQCIIIDDSLVQKVPAVDIFNVYRKWASDNNEYEMSSKKFHMEFKKKMNDSQRTRDGRGVSYTGIGFSDYGKTFVVRSYCAEQFK